MTLIRKDSVKLDCIDDFWLIILLTAELKISVKMLAKRLACVVDRLIGETQKCTGTERSVLDNRHLRYALEGFDSNSGKDGALVI